MLYVVLLSNGAIGVAHDFALSSKRWPTHALVKSEDQTRYSRLIYPSISPQSSTHSKKKSQKRILKNLLLIRSSVVRLANFITVILYLHIFAFKLFPNLLFVYSQTFLGTLFFSLLIQTGLFQISPMHISLFTILLDHHPARLEGSHLASRNNYQKLI